MLKNAISAVANAVLVFPAFMLSPIAIAVLLFIVEIDDDDT